jgi:hypothetical protein
MLGKFEPPRAGLILADRREARTGEAEFAARVRLVAAFLGGMASCQVIKISPTVSAFQSQENNHIQLK